MMNDTELREFCNQMIGKFKALSELQTEMQYETIDTKFTEWELKKLIFALDVLRITADRKTEPIDKDINVRSKTEPQSDCGKCEHSRITCRYMERGEPCHYEPKDEPQTDCLWR